MINDTIRQHAYDSIRRIRQGDAYARMRHAFAGRPVSWDSLDMIGDPAADRFYETANQLQAEVVDATLEILQRGREAGEPIGVLKVALSALVAAELPAFARFTAETTLYNALTPPTMRGIDAHPAQSARAG